MVTPTLVEAQEMYTLYLEAEKAILKGQSYTIKDRTLTRANLTSVVKARKEWQALVNQLTAGGMRVRRAVPRDI